MSKKILVADDDTDSRTMLRRLLEADGLEVIEAEDGRDAFKKAVKHNPGLILMDFAGRTI